MPEDPPPPWTARMFPPEPLTVRPGGVLRFAVGSPSGPRSSTWSVATAKRTRDVYVGSRGGMWAMKLSLHQTGRWRLAYTEQYALQIGLEGDRVIQRYEPPVEIAPGWRRAVSIVCPTANLRAAYPEKASGPISWWTAPDDRHSIWFEVLLGDVGASSATFDSIGEVGRCEFADGGGLWIMANEVSDTGREDQYRIIHETVAADYRARGLDIPYPAGMGSGFSNDDGHPMIWDAGDPTASAHVEDVGGPI